MKALLSQDKATLKVQDARLLAIEQQLTAPGFRSCSSSFGTGEDIGAAVVNSEGFKAMSHGSVGTGQINIGSFHRLRSSMHPDRTSLWCLIIACPELWRPACLP